MSGSPELSVVMSAYNGTSSLDETMQSILTQQGVDFEFVVVNDGSTDGTGALLDDYASRDSRIRVVHQENAGLTVALIRGCEAARGAFIARQDVGDLSRPARLQEQLACLKSHRDCVFVSCWTDMIGPKGEFLFTVKGSEMTAQPVNILSPGATWGHIGGPTSHPSVMLRVQQYRACGGYRPEFYFGQDWDLWYRLAEHGKFQTLQQRLCACRVTSGSISSMQKNVQEQFALLSLEAMRLRHQGLSDASAVEKASLLRSGIQPSPADRRQKAAAHYFIGRCLLENNNRACLEYLRSAVRHDPLRPQAWITLARSLKLIYSTPIVF